MKVLIVEDAAFVRKMLKNRLVDLGHEVIGEAEDGEMAIKKYIELKPDLVMMDITMPKKDGIQAAKEIIMKHPKAKIIMCSAMGQQVMVIDAIKAGARDFLVKPFDKDRMVEAIAKLSS